MKRAALLIVAALALGGRAARADDETGGSMGGGDFSDDSSSSSSSSTSDDYSSSSPSYDFSSPSSGGGGGGHSSGGGGSWAAILFVGGCAFAAVVNAFQREQRHLRAIGGTDPVYVGPTNACDVTVLRVGLDARARPFVQRELARIAKSADTKTADGRATMLREVALLLRRLRDSWLYGGARNEPMMSLRDAQVVYQTHVDDARAKFRTEMFRNEQGVVTTADAPALHSTSDDGPGVMLVSVIVAARHELVTVTRIDDGEELRKALEALSHFIAAELVAVEIVWMPAAEDERISSIALEAAYPAPSLIKLAAATAGKVFCEFCGSPYPAEAISCPNCGGRKKI